MKTINDILESKRNVDQAYNEGDHFVPVWLIIAGAVVGFLLMALMPAYAQKSRAYTDTYDTFHITTNGVTQLVAGTVYPINVIVTVNSVGGTGSAVIIKNKANPQVVLARKSPLVVGTWSLLALCEGVIADGGIEVEILGSPAPNIDILMTYAK